jgi:hypothetical protein
MTVEAIEPNDIARLLGASRLATAISAACFAAIVLAAAMLMRQSGIWPPPVIDDDAPVVSRM